METSFCAGNRMRKAASRPVNYAYNVITIMSIDSLKVLYHSNKCPQRTELYMKISISELRLHPLKLKIHRQSKLLPPNY